MKAHYEDNLVTIYCSDVLEALRSLPDESVNCCVTSPPYFLLRDYQTAKWRSGSDDCDHTTLHGVQGASGQRANRTFTGAQNFYKDQCRKCGAVRVDQQIGLEKTPSAWVGKMMQVFREVRRVLRKDGTCWVNLGDSYTSNGGHSDSACDDRRGQYNIGRRPDHKQRDTRPRGIKNKNLVGIPWRFAFAMQKNGWYLRQDCIEEVEMYCPCGCGFVLEERVWRYSQDSEVIWKKPNPMPESVRDRCTKAHEYVFMFSKSSQYFYNFEAMQEKVTGGSHARGPGNHTHKGTTAYEEGDTRQRTKAGLVAYAERKRAAGVNPKAASVELTSSRKGQSKQNPSFSAAVASLVDMRNKRSVWTVTSEPLSEAHFATYPTELIKPCILAGCPPGGTVLDPFAGSLTTMEVARDLNCKSIGIELNPEYIEIGLRCRLQQHVLEFKE